MNAAFSALRNYWQNLDLSTPRVINSFKTAIACMIGYLIVLLTPLPQSQWIVITIIVVMSAQTSIGSLTIKSYARFLGTVFGALFAVAVYLLVGTEPLGTAIALFLVVLVLAYVASSPGDMGYAGTLGAATVVIILLSPVVNLTIAMYRFIEITLGIIIAFGVSKFILPIHSYRILLSNFANNFLNLQQHFIRNLIMNPHDLMVKADELDEKIIMNFATQRKLIHEVAYEFGKYRRQKGILPDILQAQIKLYRAINLMFLSSHVSEHSVQAVMGLAGLDLFRQEANQCLRRLADVVRTGKQQELEFTVATLVDYMEHEFKKISHQKPFEHIAYVNTFLFGARLFMSELINLGKLIEDVLKPNIESHLSR